MESGEMIRPLGKMESYSTTRHWMGHYQCVGNTCTYNVPISQLDEGEVRSIVEQALARVILALPSLQVGIANETTDNPHFVQLSSLDLATHLEWRIVDQTDEQHYTEALLGAIGVQHETSWANIHNESPWKLIVFDANHQEGNTRRLDMMFAVHHAISDGKSTSVFHGELLRALNSIASTDLPIENRVLKLESPSVIVSSQEYLINFRLSWTFMLKTLWGEFAPQWLRGAPQAVPWTGKAITEGREVNYLLVELTDEKVSRIRTACRARGVTLVPLLQSILLLSLSKALPAEDATAFVAATVISLRPWVDGKKLSASIDLSKSMTDLVTVKNHVFDPDTVFRCRASSSDDVEPLLWTMASQVHQEIQEKAKTLPNDDIMGLLSWVNWAERAKGLMGNPRENTWELSNLGSVSGTCDTSELANDSRWKITRSIFTQSSHVIGPAFCANVAGIDGESLTITLSWQKGTVDRQLMERVKGDLIEWTGSLN